MKKKIKRKIIEFFVPVGSTTSNVDGRIQISKKNTDPDLGGPKSNGS
jgi:hypothetical protein